MPLPLPDPYIDDQSIRRNFEALADAVGLLKSQMTHRPPESWGLIKGSDGSILAGSGDYTSARTGAGLYTITWSTAKADAVYAIIPAPDNKAGTNSMFANWRNRLAASFGVTVGTISPLAASDADWSFVVIDNQ